MFHYFIESDTPTFDPKSIEPISYAFGGADPAKRYANGGPGAKCGFVVSRSPAPGFFHDRQTWKPIIGKTGYWLGYDNDSPPSPASLERPREEQLDGHYVRLDDERRWHVPAAIRYESDESDESDDIHRVSNVRRISGRDPASGKWVPGIEVVSRHAGLWKWAEWWFEFRQSASESGDAETAMQNFHEAAVEALAVNYYVSHDECDMLKIFSIASIRSVLDAVIDGPTFEKWYQKKISARSAGSASVNGNSGDAPGTGRRSPS